MSEAPTFEIFLAAPPGLEQVLCQEAVEKGFQQAKAVPGGMTLQGGWPDVWRANLALRGAARVLARIGSFRAMHLAQLDKRARKFPWGEVLRPDVPVRVEATCKRSRIYHAGAATQRIERALHEELGVTISPDAPLRLMARIEDDLCTFSIDTSGEPLHRRGHKEAVGKAPMRENLAALFLRQCGYDGSEPVLDPMCGSGTFVIEAAEIACGLLPGRTREFAFQHLTTFDPDQWQKMRQSGALNDVSPRFFGSDRDAGAVQSAKANAKRAGVDGLTRIENHAVSDATPPDGPAGLVIVNPPYGGRIGNKKLLFGLYGALGQTLMNRFSGWRVGVITSETSLARATGLPFLPPGPPVAHGGLKIKLFQAGPLP